jgi:hypothetical protein
MALFGRIKGRLADGLAPLEARFDAVLAGMKPRDRMLLISVIGVVLLLFAAGIGVGMRSSLDGVRKDLEKEKTRLTQVETMASQYALDSARVGELEEALNEHKGKDLSAFLEQAASKAKAADALTAAKECDPGAGVGFSLSGGSHGLPLEDRVSHREGRSWSQQAADHEPGDCHL